MKSALGFLRRIWLRSVYVIRDDEEQLGFRHDAETRKLWVWRCGQAQRPATDVEEELFGLYLALWRKMALGELGAGRRLLPFLRRNGGDNG